MDAFQRYCADRLDTMGYQVHEVWHAIAFCQSDEVRVEASIEIPIVARRVLLDRHKLAAWRRIMDLHDAQRIRARVVEYHRSMACECDWDEDGDVAEHISHAYEAAVAAFRDAVEADLTQCMARLYRAGADFVLRQPCCDEVLSGPSARRTTL